MYVAAGSRIFSKTKARSRQARNHLTPPKAFPRIHQPPTASESSRQKTSSTPQSLPTNQIPKEKPETTGKRKNNKQKQKHGERNPKRIIQKPGETTSAQEEPSQESQSQYPRQ
jgi:hypothetical protein